MEFPLAFALIVHSQVSLFEALMATIFRPHNSYCVFIDAKAEPGFKVIIRQLLNCYKNRFPNVRALIILHGVKVIKVGRFGTYRPQS